jgi:hypothetical protein
MTWLHLARLPIVVSCLALSACVTLPESAVTSENRVDDAGEVLAMLDRFDRLANQSIDDQKREFATAQSAFDRDPNDTNRLRLALALSLPQAPWRDDARLIALTAEWTTTARPSLRRDVAQLLYRLTIDRQRLVKEEQRRAEAAQQAEQKRTDNLLHDEHKKVEDLQQKLDALREIDRTTLKPPRK